MRASRPRVSLADLARAPDDGRRYELHDGEVFVVPAPRPRHQDVAANLFEILRAYARALGGQLVISPIGIVLPSLPLGAAARQVVETFGGSLAVGSAWRRE